MEEKKHCDILEEGRFDNKRYFSVIESLLFVSGEPLELSKIARILECSMDFANKIMSDMMKSYKDSSRGINIINSDEKYSLATKNDNSTYVEKLIGSNSRQSLSRASLETLSIIAYKQPITRVDIDEIRGVKSDRAISSLMDKELIRENGRLDVPGRPILYSTTDNFLRHFGFENLNMMPELDQLVKQ